MGRPAKTPSAEQRAEVGHLVKAKVAIEEIARRIGVTAKTLRKHYAAELGFLPVETVITRETFRPTDDQREMALILSGARWPHQDIADYLRISLEVLEEHFAADLEMGPKKFPAEVIKASWYAARAGNQTAAKICLLMNGAGEPHPEQQPSREGLRGKKEQAAIAARTAEQGTEWEELIGARGKPN